MLSGIEASDALEAISTVRTAAVLPGPGKQGEYMGDWDRHWRRRTRRYSVTPCYTWSQVKQGDARLVSSRLVSLLPSRSSRKTIHRQYPVTMADMEVDTPAPAAGKAVDRDEKKRFEVKKVRAVVSHYCATI